MKAFGFKSLNFRAKISVLQKFTFESVFEKIKKINP